MNKFILLLMCSISICIADENRDLYISNYTDLNMVGIYASRVTTDNWEENIIKGNIIIPTETVKINLDDGTGLCSFDLKAVFENGNFTIVKNINICNVEFWKIFKNKNDNKE